MPEPTRDQIAQDYAKALVIIDDLRGQRDDYKRELMHRDNLLAVELARVRRDRDALLAALKALNEFRELMGATLEPEVWLSSDQWHHAHDAAEAAIAKAEGS